MMIYAVLINSREALKAKCTYEVFIQSLKRELGIMWNVLSQIAYYSYHQCFSKQV